MFTVNKVKTRLLAEYARKTGRVEMSTTFIVGETFNTKANIRCYKCYDCPNKTRSSDDDSSDNDSSDDNNKREKL